MTLFLAILVLWNTKIYVYISDCCNVVADIETSVDKTLGLKTTLNILYVDPDHYHVKFGRSFNNSRTVGKNDIIKDINGL